MAQSDLVEQVIVAPGNVGIEIEPKCRLANVSSDNVSGISTWRGLKGYLTVVGLKRP
jgi:hypothetical protein